MYTFPDEVVYSLPATRSRTVVEHPGTFSGQVFGSAAAQYFDTLYAHMRHRRVDGQIQELAQIREALVDKAGNWLRNFEQKSFGFGIFPASVHDLRIGLRIYYGGTDEITTQEDNLELLRTLDPRQHSSESFALRFRTLVYGCPLVPDETLMKLFSKALPTGPSQDLAQFKFQDLAQMYRGWIERWVIQGQPLIPTVRAERAPKFYKVIRHELQFPASFLLMGHFISCIDDLLPNPWIAYRIRDLMDKHGLKFDRGFVYKLNPNNQEYYRLPCKNQDQDKDQDQDQIPDFHY